MVLKIILVVILSAAVVVQHLDFGYHFALHRLIDLVTHALRNIAIGR